MKRYAQWQFVYYPDWICYDWRHWIPRIYLSLFRFGTHLSLGFVIGNKSVWVMRHWADFIGDELKQGTTNVKKRWWRRDY